MITLQYVLFKNFQFYLFLCLKHNNNPQDLKAIGGENFDGGGLNINNDFLKLGIFIIAFTASIPLVIIKIVEIWGGFIPAI